MKIFLPTKNMPGLQILLCYGFGCNKTHMVLDLDYGSIINHHESVNVEAVNIVHMFYRVRGFSMMESDTLKL